MLNPSSIGKKLSDIGIGFYSGVPCSLLKPLINYAMTNVNYLPAVNEGDAVAHCAGAWIGGTKSVVLLQNSGLGNAVSPLTSLNYIFDIPVLGFVSLRGDPEISDEPQHELMGKITADLLTTMNIEHAILATDETLAKEQIEYANSVLEQRKSFFFIVKKNTFESYPTPPTQIQSNLQTAAIHQHKKSDRLPLRQEVLASIQNISTDFDNVITLATTGITGRELYEAGHRDNQFYMVGSMGCISAVAVGLAISRPDLRVLAIDGDGALLMRMGNLATIGVLGPPNLCHILLDNAAHESTGNQETVSKGLDFPGMAKAAGYANVISAYTPEQLIDSLDSWMNQALTTFLYMPIQARHSADLGRPKEKPKQLLNQLLNRISQKEV